VVRGVSAYSGGLWLAALRAGEETAHTLGDKATEETYHQLFHKAQQTYISKLWNGEYFRYVYASGRCLGYGDDAAASGTLELLGPVEESHKAYRQAVSTESEMSRNGPSGLH
jgi:GH15 family glucan-1,4-alpha-glucosidase